jgi:hypothetical protein
MIGWLISTEDFVTEGYVVAMHYLINFKPM